MSKNMKDLLNQAKEQRGLKIIEQDGDKILKFEYISKQGEESTCELVEEYGSWATKSYINELAGMCSHRNIEDVSDPSPKISSYEYRLEKFLNNLLA